MQRGVVLLLALAALVGTPAFSASAVLLHEHDDAGDHAHRLAAPADQGDVHVVTAWHDAEHEHVDESRRASLPPGHVPPGTLIESPASPILRPDGSDGTSHVASMAERPGSWQLDAWTPPRTFSASRGEYVPRRSGRASGALRVLRSSRALLI
ncbi:MAG: hypothetical protein ACYTG2_14795 [Planctomycetota bacterium]|jgi:hypothetical protein